MGHLRQPLQHDPYHRELGETNGGHDEGFVVGHQAAIAAQPRERAFDHPAATQDLEAALLVGAFDNLQLDRQADELARELGASIATVSKDLSQARIFLQRPFNQTGRTVPILDIPRNYLEREEVSFGVDKGVALNALNFLARIVADRINGDPPFSVAFATCVSMIAAVGSPSRPQSSRHLSMSV
jgi:hypothetical protein